LGISRLIFSAGRKKKRDREGEKLGKKRVLLADKKNLITSRARSLASSKSTREIFLRATAASAAFLAKGEKTRQAPIYDPPAPLSISSEGNFSYLFLRTQEHSFGVFYFYQVDK
jgi:hypothetical protein